MNMASVFSKRGWPCRMAAAMVVVLAALVILAIPAYTDDENITASCYKGNSDQGDYLGTVMIFSPESAGQRCNSLYYGCRGKCVGCFDDSDFGGEVCYDNAGRKFLH